MCYFCFNKITKKLSSQMIKCVLHHKKAYTFKTYVSKCYCDNISTALFSRAQLYVSQTIFFNQYILTEYYHIINILLVLI